MTLISANQLAKSAGVSQTTIRRYLTSYPAFFPQTGQGRWPKYPRECIDVAKSISALLAQGKRDVEVVEALARDFPFEVERLEPEAPAPVEPVRGAGDLVEALRLALETVADQRQTIATMAQRLEAQESRILALEGKVEALVALPAPDARKPRPDTQEREKIRQRIMELHGQGMSLRVIADKMQREGWPTFSGRGRWRYGAVARLLEKGFAPKREQNGVKK